MKKPTKTVVFWTKERTKILKKKNKQKELRNMKLCMILLHLHENPVVKIRFCYSNCLKRDVAVHLGWKTRIVYFAN